MSSLVKSPVNAVEDGAEFGSAARVDGFDERNAAAQVGTEIGPLVPILLAWAAAFAIGEDSF